ncbi:hypothetical protein DFH28DRAFT_896420 [Melampsora americana]|nr:hypothetical protein DFH28DRAFT_896420 [Melampsora americana]
MLELSKNKVPIQAPTPSASKQSNKRRQVSYSPSFSIEAKNITTQDPLGLKIIVDRFPTNEQREQSETRAAQTQENITKSITEAMSNIITNNRESELATKERIELDKNKTKEKIALEEINVKAEENKSKEKVAFEEMNVKVRLARSQLVIELLHSKMEPAAAEEFALRQLPDIQPSPPNK